MKQREGLALLVLTVFAAGAEACALSDAATVPTTLGRPESIPAGQAPPLVPPSATDGTAAGPFVIAATGTLTAVLPTERVARMRLTVTNTSATPQLLSAAQFTTTPALNPTTTPAQIRDTTLLPGESVTGAVAWRAGADRDVSTLTLHWAPPGSPAMWSVPVKLDETRADATPVRERVGLLAALRANIRTVRFAATFGSPVTFHGYYGSDWLVRAMATVTNTGRVPITVSRGHFEATNGTAPLSDLVSTPPPGVQQYYYRQNFTYCTGGRALAASTVLQPGESVTGSVCWTTPPGAAQPSSAVVTIRVPGAAASSQTLATVLGSP